MTNGELADLTDQVIERYFLKRTSDNGTVMKCSKEHLHIAIFEIARHVRKTVYQNEKQPQAPAQQKLKSNGKANESDGTNYEKVVRDVTAVFEEDQKQ